MRKGFENFKILIVAYLTIGGVGSLMFFIYHISALEFLMSLLPGLLTLAVLTFFLISGILNLLPNARKSKYESLIEISLWMQTIQVVLLGFAFKNYYGPYLGIGFTDTPSFRFISDFSFFRYLAYNGLHQESKEVSLSINLLPLCVLFIFYKLRSLTQPTPLEALTLES